jgi:hypothetical protein
VFRETKMRTKFQIAPTVQKTVAILKTRGENF